MVTYIVQRAQYLIRFSHNKHSISKRNIVRLQRDNRFKLSITSISHLVQCKKKFILNRKYYNVCEKDWHMSILIVQNVTTNDNTKLLRFFLHIFHFKEAGIKSFNSIATEYERVINFNWIVKRNYFHLDVWSLNITHESWNERENEC